MTKTILLVIAVLCAGATLTGEVFLVRQERTELEALQLRQADLQRELISFQKNNAADATRLAAMKTSVANRKSAASAAQETATSHRIEADVQAWLGKVSRLKQILAEHPDEKIPEMDLVDLREWLGAIQSADLESEKNLRKTLAELRRVAKAYYTRDVARAFTKYLKANDGELPPASSALAPFLDYPAGVSVLARYQTVKTGNVRDLANSRDQPMNRDNALLLEIAPIDEDYDYRAGVNLGRMANGDFVAMQGGSGQGPTGWIENYDTRLKQARADYARDHNGQKPSGFAQVAPYFSPALPPATVEKIIAQQQAAKKGP